MDSTAGPGYRRIYVWQFPVRLYHWVNAACITALIATGLVIGQPLRVFSASEAYELYWFGTVRFVHFVAAFIFFFNFLARIYWGFVGNEFADWKNFIPLRGEQWRQIVDVLKVDIFQATPGMRYEIGHNPLAGLLYFISFLAFAFQSITGFALYAANSSSFLPRLFTWIVPLLGGDIAVRQWHHLTMWFFIIFSVVHVYLVFYHDYVEGRGTTSSMVGGWKFERKDRLE